MSNEFQDEELDIDIPLVDLESKTVICPICNNKVPVSLYCIACNSPLEVSGGETNDGTEKNSENFDVESLREMLGKEVVQIDENVEEPSPNHGVDSNEMEFRLTPVKQELAPPIEEVFGIKFTDLNESSANVESLNVASSREENEYDPRIKQLAVDLFKSIYLELWSVKQLEKSEIDEAHFLRLFRGYRERLEGCIAQRDNFLEKCGELKEFDIKARDSRIELEELEVRKGLGDLAKGEYEALAPALRWVINFNESERDRLENRLAIIEDLSQAIPQEGILEIKSMIENAEKVINEVRVSSRLSQELVDEVGDSIKRINGLLSVQSEESITDART
jgi:hypothetical protein